MKVILRSVAIALAAASCDSTAPSESMAERVPEDRGTNLGFAGSGQTAVWTSNTSLVYMRASDNTRDLRLVDVTTSQAAVLHQLSQGLLSWVTTDPSRQNLFYTVAPLNSAAGDKTLYRLQLPGGAPQAIRDLVQGYPGVGGLKATPFRVTPDGTRLLFLSRDSLFEYTISTGQARFVGTGCRGLAAISPTSDRVLCVVGDQLQNLTLSDGSSVAVPLAADLPFRLRGFRWAAAGIQLLYHDYPKLTLMNAADGTTREVFTLAGDALGALSAADYTSLDWSDDGTRIAFWKSECVRDTGFLSCERQFRLTIVSLDAVSVRNAAVFHEGGGELFMNPVFISPDRRRIAYQAAGVMWVNDIP